MRASGTEVMAFPSALLSRLEGILVESQGVGTRDLNRVVLQKSLLPHCILRQRKQCRARNVHVPQPTRRPVLFKSDLIKSRKASDWLSSSPPSCTPIARASSA